MSLRLSPLPPHIVSVKIPPRSTWQVQIRGREPVLALKFSGDFGDVCLLHVSPSDMPGVEPQSCFLRKFSEGTMHLENWPGRDVRLVFGNSGDTDHAFHIQVISESSPALP